MSGFVLAVRYLTIVPVPGGAHAPVEGLGRSVAWFPVVGALLGVVVAVGERAASAVLPPLLAALMTLILWKWLTGGLHLDGLADCLDGLIGRDCERRLAIMRDSRVGTFGAVGLIFALMLGLVAIVELPPVVRSGALVAAPAVGRAAPGLLGRLFPAARREGLGAAFEAGLGRGGVLLAIAVGTSVAAVILGMAGLVAGATGLGLAVAVGRLMSGRLGGITGDVHGAGVEVAELAVLITVAAWAHAQP